MTLDFIDNLNHYGDNIVRLYDFGKEKSIKFKKALEYFIKSGEQTIDLASFDFIQERNCKLYLALSDEDLGIITRDKQIFFCAMTLGGFQDIIDGLEPFCKKETKGYKMLYDIDSNTDFLFSPAGTWEEDEVEESK